MNPAQLVAGRCKSYRKGDMSTDIMCAMGELLLDGTVLFIVVYAS